MKLTPELKFGIDNKVFDCMTECGSCGSYHPSDYEGDCRDDDFRYHPDDMATVLKAAPDLLEACEVAVLYFERVLVDKSSQTYRTLTETIKKAKG